MNGPPREGQVNGPPREGQVNGPPRFVIDADLRRAVGHGGGSDRALIAQVKRATALGRTSLRTQGAESIAEPDPRGGPRWRLAAPRLGRGCFHEGCAPTHPQEQGGTHWCRLAPAPPVR